MQGEARHIAGDFENVGVVPFRDVLDLAGNANIEGQISASVNDSDGNDVTYDNTAPILSNITFTSNNPIDSQWANEDDIVTVTFEC